MPSAYQAANGAQSARTPVIRSFPYYGGKMHHLAFILEHLPPPGNNAIHFVDVFGGSGVVTINVNYPLRTYNDLNSRLVHFFRVLRKRPDELIAQLQLTPYSREEFLEAEEELPEDEADPELEDARRFFVLVGMSYGARPINVRSWTVHRQVRKWQTNGFAAQKFAHLKIPQLRHIVERFQEVQIECIDGVELVGKSDLENNVLYLDPPYPPETRRSNAEYGDLEMNFSAHERLVDQLKQVRHAKVALSSYPNDLYDSLGWRRVLMETTCRIPSLDNYRVEALYMNYDPPVASLLDRKSQNEDSNRS